MPFILGNAKGQFSQRLRSITTKTNGNVYRTYTLNYNTTGDGIPTPFSRLASISVANAKGESLKPISLNWAYFPAVWEWTSHPGGDVMPTSLYSSVINGNPQMVSGDYNGDGLADFVMVDKEGDPNCYMALSNGNGTFNKEAACKLPFYDQTSTGKDNWKFSVNVLDFDMDGKSDVVITKPMYGFGDLWDLRHQQDLRHMVALHRHGAHHGGDRHVIERWRRKAWYFTTGDLDCDGHTELLNYGYDCFNATDASASPTWNIYSDVAVTDNTGKVTSVTDSYGSTTSIAYSQLTRNGIYAKGAGSTYPMVDLAASISVVRTVTEGNGAAGDITTNYSYAGLKAHLQGKGLLGVSSHTATDAATGYTTTSGVSSWNTRYWIQPDYILAYHNKMSFQMDIGLMDEAIATAEKLERIMPEASWLKLQLGVMYEKYKKDYAHAFLKYNEAISIGEPLTANDYRNNPGVILAYATNLKLLGKETGADSVVRLFIKSYHDKNKVLEKEWKEDMCFLW